jgi:hypothetical protein
MREARKGSNEWKIFYHQDTKKSEGLKFPQLPIRLQTR